MKTDIDTKTTDEPTSKPIGSGFNGVVYKPPPRSGRPDLDRFCRSDFVLKVTNRRCGMHAVRVAQAIRNAWPKLVSSSSTVSAVVRGRTPADFFLLPFDLVRDMSMYPAAQIDPATQTTDPLRRLLSKIGAAPSSDDLVGLYMVDGGKLWSTVFVAGTKSDVRDASLRLLQSLLVLHAAGIAHLDVHAKNVLVDPSGVPRLIDYESATIYRPDGKPESVQDQASSSAASWMAYLSGRGKDGPAEQKSRDWSDAAKLLLRTDVERLSTVAGRLLASPTDETAASIVADWT